MNMTISRRFRRALLSGAFFLSSPLAQAAFVNVDSALSTMAQVLPAGTYKGKAFYQGNNTTCLVRVEMGSRQLRVSISVDRYSFDVARFDSESGISTFVANNADRDYRMFELRGPKEILTYSTRPDGGVNVSIRENSDSMTSFVRCNILP